jgi:hypothetical protein
MTPFEYIKNCVVSILKPSRIHGVGFFAIRDIELGESIFDPWFGESGIYHITHDELTHLPEELQQMIIETFDNQMYYIDKKNQEQYVGKEYGKIFFPLEKGYHWIYIWPKTFINSGLDKANVDTINHINPVSKRKIFRGEELLANYGSEFKTTPKNFI